MRFAKGLQAAAARTRERRTLRMILLLITADGGGQSAKIDIFLGDMMH
jgi:hypothetical protein